MAEKPILPWPKAGDHAHMAANALRRDTPDLDEALHQLTLELDNDEALALWLVRQLPEAVRRDLLVKLIAREFTPDVPIAKLSKVQRRTADRGAL